MSSREVSRIGVNLLFLLPNRGGREMAGRQLLGAIHELEPELELLVYAGPSAIAELRRTEAWAEGATLRSTPVPVGSVPVRVGAELTWLPTQARRDGVQLLHSLGNTAPARLQVPSVMTIHDLHYHRFPDIQDRQTRVGLQILVRTAARHSKRIICPSRASKEDVVEILGIDPERVHVIPHGPGRPAAAPLAEDELRSRHRLGAAPLIFCPAVGFIYKNMARLLEAFALIAPDSDAILVQAGWPAREGDALRARADELGIGDRVRFLGWVDDATVESLYGASRLLVTPSIAEGFGLPVLEAMCRGLPVACSGISALPEVAGDAAETFDPYDERAIAAALMRLLEDRDRREELIARGRRQAACFSWERAARETLDVYEHAIHDEGPAGPSRRVRRPRVKPSDDAFAMGQVE